VKFYNPAAVTCKASTNRTNRRNGSRS